MKNNKFLQEKVKEFWVFGAGWFDNFHPNNKNLIEKHLTQALSDAIKYGEEKFVRSIKNDCSCRYAGEIVCCHEDCEKCEPIKKLLAKLTISQEEG